MCHLYLSLHREIKGIQTSGNMEHKVVASDTNFDSSDTKCGDYENVELPTSNTYTGGLRASTIYEEMQCSS